MKKTILKISPVILLAVSLCATGSGIGIFLYYSDNVRQKSTNDGHVLTDFDTQKSVTVYEITNKDSTLSTIPSQISIIDNYDEKQNVFSYEDILTVIWIPLLIIGSYILVHSKDGIESKVDA